MKIANENFGGNKFKIPISSFYAAHFLLRFTSAKKITLLSRSAFSPLKKKKLSRSKRTKQIRIWPSDFSLTPKISKTSDYFIKKVSENICLAIFADGNTRSRICVMDDGSFAGDLEYIMSWWRHSCKILKQYFQDMQSINLTIVI